MRRPTAKNTTICSWSSYTASSVSTCARRNILLQLTAKTFHSELFILRELVQGKIYKLCTNCNCRSTRRSSRYMTWCTWIRGCTIMHIFPIYTETRKNQQKLSREFVIKYLVGKYRNYCGLCPYHLQKQIFPHLFLKRFLGMTVAG